ncbi:hypothetical protein LTR48_003525 [Friedmanniomyces endolithicus]|uniref:Extracellular membrane protein CFEM domain-containing protein n=1 Tax=Rachicladosporium monterosium TaxID=1507873 RepID=A0ABR0L6D4_9PEZI|nr:hypothetical protein LTS09_008618 [Friedmanniomyces endolithicus]KAK1092851.1 hypothetical protein LTR48_003525 [Friedmanniomyces endolithicus]KAK5144172.1 hypothetical protein LTR32_003841 [Rachicladosporium monterosium]
MAKLTYGSILLAYIITYTIAQISAASQACLSACLTNSTNPCTADSLPALMYCLTTSCSTISEQVLANLHVAYTPKVEYSCENSMVPGNSPGNDVPTLVLSGSGNCETSPYDFQSFVAGTRSELTDEMCQLKIFAGEGCTGDATSLSMSDGVEECQFAGGRSAKLSCQVGEQSQPLSIVAVSRLQTLCSNATAQSPPAVASFGYNNATTPASSPGHGSGPTSTTSSTRSERTSTTMVAPLAAHTISSNVTSTTTQSAPPAPFAGMASVDHAWQVLGVAGVVMVGAAFAML